MSHAHVQNMASMRGATRSRHTIHHVWTHFQVLHPSRSAHTHTTRSRDAARTTAYSEPRQTSPSTMLIPTRTARSFECRGDLFLDFLGQSLILFGKTDSFSFSFRMDSQSLIFSKGKPKPGLHIRVFRILHLGNMEDRARWWPSRRQS